MTDKHKIKIFISAGDPSGDIHAANLMKQLKQSINEIEFIGIGGKEMEKQGLNSIVNINEISVVGFWEVAKKYSFFKKLESQCQKLLKESNIDLFIPVDYPGFNIRLAKYAKEINIPVVYYIAPQLWAWGKNRAKKLKNAVDKLLVVFPFEVDFFKSYNIDCEFVGHPLLDLEQFEEAPKSDERKNQICLVPGSREQEVSKHLELFQQVIDKSNIKGYDFTLSKSASLNDDIYEKFSASNNNLNTYNNSRDAMKESYCGIVKAGTSTLEAALLGMPFVTIYKTSQLSYLISKRLVDINYVSIPNILLDKQVVTELLQKDATPQKILDEVNKLITDKELYQRTKSEFTKIRQMLEQGSASENAASIITEQFIK